MWQCVNVSRFLNWSKTPLVHSSKCPNSVKSFAVWLQCVCPFFGFNCLQFSQAHVKGIGFLQCTNKNIVSGKKEQNWTVLKKNTKWVKTVEHVGQALMVAESKDLQAGVQVGTAEKTMFPHKSLWPNQLSRAQWCHLHLWRWWTVWKTHENKSQGFELHLCQIWTLKMCKECMKTTDKVLNCIFANFEQTKHKK